MLRQPSLRSDAIPERNCRRTAAHTSAFPAAAKLRSLIQIFDRSFDVKDPECAPPPHVCANLETGRLARRRKPGEVFGLYFLLGQYVANLLHFANVIDRIHLLDVHRINAVKPWPIQAFAGKLGEDSGAEIPRIPPPLHASSFRGPILFNFVALTHCSDGNRSDKRTRLVLPLTQHLPQSDFQCLCGFIEWK